MGSSGKDVKSYSGPSPVLLDSKGEGREGSSDSRAYFVAFEDPSSYTEDKFVAEIPQAEEGACSDAADQALPVEIREESCRSEEAKQDCFCSVYSKANGKVTEQAFE